MGYQIQWKYAFCLIWICTQIGKANAEELGTQPACGKTNATGQAAAAAWEKSRFGKRMVRQTPKLQFFMNNYVFVRHIENAN